MGALQDKARRAANIIRQYVFSPRGKSVLTFCVFLAISSALWVVMSLNQEMQQDIRCRVEIVNKPDSVTMISYLPDDISVSVKSRGSQLIKFNFGTPPTISIDYKYMMHDNRISVGTSEMRALLRNVFGQNSQILSFSPDTLSIMFTSRPGVSMPVNVASQVSTRSDFALAGAPKCVPASVVVYSTRPLSPTADRVVTPVIQYTDISETQTIRTRVIVPPGCRAFPDSVSVTFRVEPLIARSIKLPITAINVPDSARLILLPTTVNVSYMVPANIYNEQLPPLVITADYRSIDMSHPTRRICIKADNSKVPELRNIRLSTDSVEYMVER